MTQPITAYAWCFSHGRLHCFIGDPWCTASWAPLPGDTKEEAMAFKEEEYGDAQFLHHLPGDQQLALIKQARPDTRLEEEN